MFSTYQRAVDFLGATEIREFAAASLIHKDVGSLDVSVDHVVDVEVFNALEDLLGVYSNEVFVHWVGLVDFL